MTKDLTNEDIRVILERMKSEEGFNPAEWPEWLIEKLQEWFGEREDDAA
jgi:hypothetical protein